MTATRRPTDTGSTAPALLPALGGRRLAVQGGEDRVLKRLDLGRLNGTTSGTGARLGGELQRIAAPGPAQPGCGHALASLPSRTGHWNRRGQRPA
jgi:hypothetical protein